MNKILLSILTVCICLLSSCTKEDFPVDAYVGHYILDGTANYGKATMSATGVMNVYPTGKDTFSCKISFQNINEGVSFNGYIDNGKMKFHPNKNLDKASSATMTDGDSQVANISIKISHTVGTGQQIVAITVTATKD
ncbi:MAG: hypothetical protein MJZ16_01495 [Bacteroidales bacterium]|nr:hypothetical protein [Bacteroidales bacterium]